MPMTSAAQRLGTFALIALPLLSSLPAAATPALLPIAAAADQNADIDKQAWNETSKANTVQAYQAYIDAFPNGAYVGLAKVRLSALRNSGANAGTSQAPITVTTTVPPKMPAPVAPPAPAQVRIVRIGHVAPLTGQISHLGRDNENGARLAIEELNNENIVIGGARIQFELVAKDDGANPQMATAVARELVEANVAGVVGHLNSGTTVPASKIYFQAGIPEISPSATNPMYTKQGFNTAFRLITNDEDLSTVIGQYATDNYHPSRVVIVSDGTAYGNGVGMTFQKQAIAAGEQVVDYIAVGTKQTEFSSEAERIRVAAPDVVFFAGMDSGAAPLLRAIHATGLNPWFGGADGICTESMGRMADNADKVFCGESAGELPARAEAMRGYRERYRARFGGAGVVLFSPYTYDGVRILVQAMRNADSVEPMRYLTALQNMSYSGVAGNYQFSPSGDNLYRTVTIHGYQNGRRLTRTVVESR